MTSDGYQNKTIDILIDTVSSSYRNISTHTSPRQNAVFPLFSSFTYTIAVLLLLLLSS